MKKICKILCISCVIVSLFTLTGCDETEESKRYEKTEQSMREGLNRTIYVYSQNGELLREYHGKVDIEDNDAGSKVLFDNDGKRYIIYGGVVIIEED